MGFRLHDPRRQSHALSGVPGGGTIENAKEYAVKVGRNSPCPCGSGKKYKRCCYAKDSVKHEAPEPAEDAVSEGTAADDVDVDPSDKKATKTPQAHQKDRSRFQGDARGRSVSFRPKASRGSQRGT